MKIHIKSHGVVPRLLPGLGSKVGNSTFAIDPRRRETSRRPPILSELSSLPHMSRYRAQRYRLFSRYDEGVGRVAGP